MYVRKQNFEKYCIFKDIPTYFYLNIKNNSIELVSLKNECSLQIVITSIPRELSLKLFLIIKVS